jgi:hypothetical protein
VLFAFVLNWTENTFFRPAGFAVLTPPVQEVDSDEELGKKRPGAEDDEDDSDVSDEETPHKPVLLTTTPSGTSAPLASSAKSSSSSASSTQPVALTIDGKVKKPKNPHALSAKVDTLGFVSNPNSVEALDPKELEQIVVSVDEHTIDAGSMLASSVASGADFETMLMGRPRQSMTIPTLSREQASRAIRNAAAAAKKINRADLILKKVSEWEAQQQQQQQQESGNGAQTSSSSSNQHPNNHSAADFSDHEE